MPGHHGHRDRRARAMLQKRYPSPRGPFPTDERSYAQLVTDAPGAARIDLRATAATLAQLQAYEGLRRALGRNSMPWGLPTLLPGTAPRSVAWRATDGALGARRAGSDS